MQKKSHTANPWGCARNYQHTNTNVGGISYTIFFVLLSVLKNPKVNKKILYRENVYGIKKGNYKNYWFFRNSVFWIFSFIC